MSRRHLAAAAGVLLIASLTGCAQQAATPQVTPTPTTTTSATPRATPTAESTEPAFDFENYDCETLLPPATLAVFQSKASEGFTLQADFTDRVQNFGSNLVGFLDNDGIVCEWAYPSGSVPADYAFSPISADDADDQMASLIDGGFVASEVDNGTLVVNEDVADFPDSYLFADGYWFYASEQDLLDLIVGNVLGD
jgi:hypothetical protein